MREFYCTSSDDSLIVLHNFSCASRTAAGSSTGRKSNASRGRISVWISTSVLSGATTRKHVSAYNDFCKRTGPGLSLKTFVAESAVQWSRLQVKR